MFTNVTELCFAPSTGHANPCFDGFFCNMNYATSYEITERGDITLILVHIVKHSKPDESIVGRTKNPTLKLFKPNFVVRSKVTNKKVPNPGFEGISIVYYVSISLMLSKSPKPPTNIEIIQKRWKSKVK